MQKKKDKALGASLSTMSFVVWNGDARAKKYKTAPTTQERHSRGGKSPCCCVQHQKIRGDHVAQNVNAG